MMEMTEELTLLTTKRDKLVERLDAIKQDIGRGLNRDSSEQAVELENAEVLDEIARVTQNELDRLNARIARLQ